MSLGTADIRPQKADLRPEKADLRPERVGGIHNQMDGQTDGRT